MDSPGSDGMDNGRQQQPGLNDLEGRGSMGDGLEPGAAFRPPDNSILSVDRTPATRVYRKRKREMFLELHPTESNCTIAKRLFSEMKSNGFDFWKGKDNQWDVLDDDAALKKVKQDIRMMKNPTRTKAARKSQNKAYLVGKYSQLLQVLRATLQGCNHGLSGTTFPKVGDVVFGQYVPPEKFDGNLALLCLKNAVHSRYEKSNDEDKKYLVDVIISILKECGAEFVCETEKNISSEEEEIYLRVRQRLTDASEKMYIDLDLDLPLTPTQTHSDPARSPGSFLSPQDAHSDHEAVVAAQRSMMEDIPLDNGVTRSLLDSDIDLDPLHEGAVVPVLGAGQTTSGALSARGGSAGGLPHLESIRLDGDPHVVPARMGGGAEASGRQERGLINDAAPRSLLYEVARAAPHDAFDFDVKSFLD